MLNRRRSGITIKFSEIKRQGGEDLAHEEPLFGAQFSRFEQDALGEHEILGLEASGTEGQDVWVPVELKAGKQFNQPVPLIKKLDHKIVEEERGRLGQSS